MDNTYKLKYIVEGNAAGMRPVRQELEKTDKAITHLGAGKGLSGLASSLSGFATGSQLNGITSQITSASSALSALPGPAGLAAGAIALVATASIGAGVALFGLAKQASDYGSEIFDASEKTGLSAETLSSFKLAADQSSSSLEQVTSGVAKFSKTVGEAALGSEEAAAKLKRLGVDPQKAIKDLDGALGDVFKRIAALPPGVTQSKAAMDAFGKSGADLLPFIKSFNGDLPALIAKCKELGITLADKDARAADEFGDQMDTLTAQLKMVGITFGQELMPVFLKGAQDISGWLSKNKGEIRAWGESTANVLTGLGVAWRAVKQDAIDAWPYIAGAAGQSDTVQQGLLWSLFAIPMALSKGLKSIEQVGAAVREQTSGVTIPDWAKPKTPKTLPGADSDYLDNLKGQKDAAAKARKEREEIAKRDAAAQVQILKRQYDEWVDYYVKTVDKAKNALEKGGSVEGFTAAMNDAAETYKSNISEIFNALKDAEIQAAQLANKTANEMKVLDDEQKDRWKKSVETTTAAFQSGEKAIADSQKKASDDSDKQREKAFSDSIALTGAYYAKEQAELDRQHDVLLSKESAYQAALGALLLKEMEDELALMEKAGKSEVDLQVQRQKIATQRIKNSHAVFVATDKEAKEEIEANRQRADAVQELADAIDELDAANRRLKAEDKARRTIGSSSAVSAMGELHEMFVSDQNTAAIAGVEALTSAFDGLGQAVGAAVSAYVLYGSMGTSVREVTAQILAGIAQQAAVKAVYELAEGFAMLALALFGMGTGPSAAAHFQAAAIYGAVAGVAALAGRAVAGDSFKKDGESGQSASNSGNSTTSGNSRSSENLTPYSRQNENTFVSGRSDTAAAIGGLRDEVRALHQKISSKPSAVIVAEAMRQNPSAVPNHIMKYNQRNPTPFRTALKQSKIR